MSKTKRKTPAEGQAIQAQAQAAREERQREKEARIKFVSDIAKENHLKFTHVPLSAFGENGVTLAYQYAAPRDPEGAAPRDILNVSTALQHPNDDYDKEVGRFVATQNFLEGRFVQLRKPRHMTAHEFLKGLFGYKVNLEPYFPPAQLF